MGEVWTPSGTCTYCGNPVDVDRDYQLHVGWASRRAAGGLNALRLRTERDLWACAHCVDYKAKGIDPGQVALFGQAP
jgi:hypothetical protein